MSRSPLGRRWIGPRDGGPFRDSGPRGDAGEGEERGPDLIFVALLEADPISSRRMLGWLVRLLFPPAFVVEIREGSAAGRKGSFPGGYLGDCSDVAQSLGLRTGRIYGVRGRGGLALEFSRDIPPECHQRFRNVFGIYRHRFRN